MSAINNVMKNNFRNLELDEFFGNIKRRRIWTCRCIKDANRDQNYLKCYSSGLVIGRKGTGMLDLTTKLEQKFGLTNPQISVTEF